MDQQQNAIQQKGSEEYAHSAFGLRQSFDHINQGTVAVEVSRAVAEAQGKLIIAKRFPRDEISSYARVMQACRRKGVAEKAFYSYSRAGNVVSGPTIRFAEELARCWGNIDYGIKELSQSDGASEMQAYAWDLETNAISVQNFTNPHMRETAEKDPETGKKHSVNKKLTSLRDIYEINANMGARRLRSRILAILPSDLVDDAIAECRKTLAGESEAPLIDRIRKMVTQFEKFGVSQDMLEKRLGRKISAMTTEDFTDYIGIFNAIKNGESKPSDWFDASAEARELTAALDSVLSENGGEETK